MPSLTSIQDIDLTPAPGKTYTNFEREWREEFIYFLMVDRFHDDQARTPVSQPGRSVWLRDPEQLLRWNNQGHHGPSRLHCGAGLHGDLAVARPREQRRRLPRLQHQELP